MSEAFSCGGGGGDKGLYCWKRMQYEIVQASTEALQSIYDNYYVYYSDSPPELNNMGNLTLPNLQGGTPPSGVSANLSGKYVTFGDNYIKATSNIFSSGGAYNIRGYKITRNTLAVQYVVSNDPAAYPANGKQGGYYYAAVTK